ncbi:MAG: FAD-binding oxidoreductase, partial [Alphaproteobacteria bacterium]|nr:FAD-binding oxidoreductase [Alphaproteobacteria bacterium]
KIVLALNAWAHELPEFRRAVMPICADGIATAPIPEKLESLGLRDGLAISDSRTMVDYYRRTADGRMVYGKGGGAIPFAGRMGSRFDAESPRPEEVRAAMLRNYPALGDVPIVASWRGPATRTATGLPMFGRMTGAPAIVYGHGYIGNGVGPSYNGGRILAALALDRKDEWSECPLVGARGKLLPPEPFRFFGGQMVRAAVRAKDHADDLGRKSGFPVRYLAGLAPSGLTARTGDRA